MKTSADTSFNGSQKSEVGSQKLKDWKIGWLLLAFVLAGCGKVGDPLPPIPRAPLIVNELTGEQRGTNIILSFPITRPPRSRNIKRVDIYRLIEPSSAPLGLTEADFSSRASVISSILGEQLPSGSATVTYNDPIDFSRVSAAERLRYAVRLVDVEDRAADLSNYAVITPLSELAGPPTDLQTKLSQTEIEITWQPPATNINGNAPANVTGYNIYRTTADATVKLNQQPLREPRYVDRQFQFGTTYEYVVRSVSLPNPGAPITAAIESNPSQPIAINPKDTFAPSAPASVTIASVGGVMSLFWPANPEPDVIGYNVYRAEDQTTPLAAWTKITPRPITTITFSDKQVQVGKRYYYQITAVDNAGNESARSETQSEIVNP